MESHREDGFPCFYATDGSAWRQWLSDHHTEVKRVWLILFHKSSETPSVYYDEAVDEALCFGWVDSKPNKRDGESYYQLFSQRNPKSNWSAVNKAKVERLQAEGRLAESGLEMIRVAKETGTWDALNDVEALIVPDDLAEAFRQHPGSAEHWDAFPRSVKRGILEWVFNAKRAETRAKRVLDTASKAQVNVRANQFR